MTKKTKIILLADDDMEDQEILEDAILQLEPITEVRIVANGQQVIEFLQNCTDTDLPSLIILDYKMPILNAAEVLERIHPNARFQTIPKVVWSSSKQPEHVQVCIDKGAVNYFVKPNKINDLRQIVSQMLAISKDAN
jgi:Response regulator containing CheY-like receiver, AAA-type ATPase, and DNA-binding domains